MAAAIPDLFQIRHHLRRHGGRWLAVTLMSLVLGITTAAIYSLLGPMFEALTNPGSTVVKPMTELLGPTLGQAVAAITGRDELAISGFLDLLPIGLAALATLRAVLSASQWYLWEVTCEAIAKDMRQSLVEVFLATKPAEVAGSAIDSSLSSTLTTDIKLIKEFLVRYYGGLPRELMQVVIFAITLILLSPKLFGLFFLGVIPALVISRRLGKKILRRTEGALSDYSELTSWLENRFLGIETIKHFGTEALETERMAKKNSQMTANFIRSARAQSQTAPALEFIGVCALAVVLYFVFQSASAGEMSGSVQLAFFANLAVMAQSAAKLGKYLNSAKSGRAAVNRLNEQVSHWQKFRAQELLSFDPALADDTVVAIKDVTVTYPGGERPALAGLSLEIKAGQSYAFAGPSGSGKSTAIKAILGLQPPDTGQVLFHPSLEQGLPVLYVPQTLILAPASLAANIAYPDEAIAADKIAKALTAVGLAPLTPTAFAEPATPLGQPALSGGQAQRVLLARIHYHDPKLLVVDEGTSALDAESERLIIAVLKEKVAAGAALVMVAHRQKMIAMVDHVITLEAGRQRG